ncbi:MAG: saccharopine dehydrogenase [Candidatus Heimdallarchaeota archaeon]|nr:saccharopine dehydrogenase [Candidatus Heimdallarchaeota archaeon]
MAIILVLGGCGVVGSMAVKTLGTFADVSKIIIGDKNHQKANEIITELGSNKIIFKQIDVENIQDLKKELEQVDVVLNCIGPFYLYGPLVLRVAIEMKKNYIDVNDDVDATREVLSMDKLAKEAKITALIGMGSSPGVTNLLAKFAAKQLLDTVKSVDIYHAHGGEPFEGAAVIYHRIHSMSIEIPVFINGSFQNVNFFGKNGEALEEEILFHKIGTYRVHPYPHPETITLPKYLEIIDRVTNKGTVLPPEYFYLIRDLVKLGLNDNTLINVKGNLISSLDFIIPYIIHQRERILKEINFGPQQGCIKIVVEGIKDQKPQKCIFSLTSEGKAMGEGTGLPAAFGTILMIRNQVRGKGVLPPEACVNPLEFLEVMREHLDLDSTTGGGSPLLIEIIDSEGNINTLDL